MRKLSYSPHARRKRQGRSVLLLSGCFLFSLGGLFILLYGALEHGNPEMSFTGLFSKESLMNLVQSFVPRIR